MSGLELIMQLSIRFDHGGFQTDDMDGLRDCSSWGDLAVGRRERMLPSYDSPLIKANMTHAEPNSVMALELSSAQMSQMMGVPAPLLTYYDQMSSVSGGIETAEVIVAPAGVGRLMVRCHFEELGVPEALRVARALRLSSYYEEVDAYAYQSRVEVGTESLNAWLGRVLNSLPCIEPRVIEQGLFELDTCVVSRSELGVDSKVLTLALSNGWGPEFPISEDVVRRWDRAWVALRANRAGHVSLGGAAFVSSRHPVGNAKYDLNVWPGRFLRHYVWLANILRVELDVVLRLQLQLSHIDLSVGKLRGSKVDWSETLNAAEDLAFAMQSALNGYSIDYVGGNSDYADFYDALRTAYRLSEAREELRSRIRSTSDLIRLSSSAHAQAEQRIELERRARFDVILAFVSAFFLPMSVITGILGMNTSNGFPNISFSEALLYGLIGSLAALIATSSIFLFLRRRRRPDFPDGDI